MHPATTPAELTATTNRANPRSSLSMTMMVLVSLISQISVAEDRWTVESPDGQLQIAVSLQAPQATADYPATNYVCTSRSRTKAFVSSNSLR